MDIMNFEILEDGTITVKTSEISDGNHMSADALLADMEKLMGGTMTFTKNPDAKAHAHMHRHGVHHAHNH
jgi:hypothetical protein